MRTLILALLIVSQIRAQAASASVAPSTEAGTPAAVPSGPEPATPPPSFCPAGAPLGDVDLRVQSARGDTPLPLRTINRLTEGDTVLYVPLLRGRAERQGEVALVLVPAVKKRGKDNLIVTEPKNAENPQQWKIEETSSVAAFVYGPGGLSKKKVKGFLTQDDLLIAQLADYAEKTAQTEALIQALSGNSSNAGVNAALTGFASQYGLGVQIDRTQPANVQAMALFQTMNPALSSYDPLQPSTAARYGQTATVATAVATLFFGNPVGLAAGGTAMLLDLKALAFPGAEFRSSFAVPLANERGLNLCGRRDPAPPHTKVAYIWATRIPNTKAPFVRVEKTDYVPQTQKSPVPVTASEPDWKYLERTRHWELVNDKGEKTSISVLKLANQRSIEVDLSKVNVPPGDYRLTGYWDWEPFKVDGLVHVMPLSDFKLAKLEPESQDKLIAKTGKTPVTLVGSDFEFTTKVELKKIGDEFATSSPVPFKLAKGLREGPQDHMNIQINTVDLDPGDYSLLISQQDDEAHPVNIKILPSLAKIENLPMIANEGVQTQNYVLKGENLGLIAKLETPGAVLELEPVTSAQTERKVTLHLQSSPPPGSTLQLKAYLRDRSEPLTFADAIRVTGPLPAITASTPSPPSGMSVSIREGEFPAGFTLSAMLNAKNVQPSSILKLKCVGDDTSRLSLPIGSQSDTSSLQPMGNDQFFVSFDTSSWPGGCAIQAAFDNGSAGHSEPFTLGHIIRLPQIETFKMTDEEAMPGFHVGLITGRNLEMIEKVGWDLVNSNDVLGLPAPLPGPGQKQLLRVKLPEPPNPQASLSVWLRGENDGRTTTVALGQGDPTHSAKLNDR
jgi:hypothetical protein